jgi:two-component system copper resistance phosphate regulon response regulator CusR
MSSKCILIIEDNNDIRESTAEILELAGYKVQQASNGKAGVDLAQQHKPDVILCDIMMPELDGYGVLFLLGKNPETATIPFIFLTAKAERVDFRKGMEMGADDYLTKPFEFGELLARMRALLRRTGELRPAQISVADLVVDTVGQRVTRGGRSIAFTAKEYALLEFLARNEGRVVGRAEIAEHVWDEEFDPFSNLIEVYVNRVRRKIDAPPHKPLLHTRRGAGYILSQRAEATAASPPPITSSKKSHA